MSDTTARHVIGDYLAGFVTGYTGDDRIPVTNSNKRAGQDVIAALEAAGFRVVPTDLLTNAEDVCQPATDDDWTIVRKTAFDALAASVAAYDGNDPLDVFAGKP